MVRSRRFFLKTALGTSAFFSLSRSAPLFLSRSSPAGRRSGNVLVVVQLAGGNDGLNTVIPYGDDLYWKNRPTLRHPKAKLHKIDGYLAFHPRMEGFFRLYREGHLTVVQGVGYPNPSRDHLGAMRNWQTARPEDPYCRTGWIGRAVDRKGGAESGDVPAVFVGNLKRPLALNAERAVVPALRSPEFLTLEGSAGCPDPVPPGGGATDLSSGRKVPFLPFLRRTEAEAYADAARVEKVLAKRKRRRHDPYPPFPFARNLRAIADLIRAELGIRIFYTELGGASPGGFDNHANQLGNHGALLNRLSESVAAFVEDLKRDGLLDRVLLMTFSEFGRTLAENGRRGTGHGAAAPLFLVGGKVRGGLRGRHPPLEDLDAGGLRHHTDFRRVYSEALQFVGSRL